MKQKNELPELPLAEWEDTKTTLHLLLQIMGKTRLKMTPRKNHWWYITEYISSKGFTTSTIPCQDGYNSFEIILNVHKSQVEIESSYGEQEKIIPIYDGLSVAEFYSKYIKALDELNIHPNIYDKPFDMNIDKKFAELNEYHKFDIVYVKRFWKILLWVSSIFKEFSGRYYGKTSPVQLYWHHMDLAVSRLSDKKAPKMDATTRLSDKDAYSHEVISFGFWAGDDIVREPAFYSYTYPSPEGINNIHLQPDYANWVESNGSPLAFLSYHKLLEADNPRSDLLKFLESAYQAGAKLAKWNITSLRTLDLDEL